MLRLFISGQCLEHNIDLLKKECTYFFSNKFYRRLLVRIVVGWTIEPMLLYECSEQKEPDIEDSVRLVRQLLEEKERTSYSRCR